MVNTALLNGYFMNRRFVINMTPHPIRIARSVFANDILIPLTAEDLSISLTTASDVPTQSEPTLEIPVYREGWRLPAQAVTKGPLHSCRVRYADTNEMIEQAEQLLTELAQLSHCHGIYNVVILMSEISVRASKGLLEATLNDQGLGLLERWPILADVAVSLPPHQRWADRLGCLPNGPTSRYET